MRPPPEDESFFSFQKMDNVLQPMKNQFSDLQFFRHLTIPLRKNRFFYPIKTEEPNNLFQSIAHIFGKKSIFLSQMVEYLDKKNNTVLFKWLVDRVWGYACH